MTLDDRGRRAARSLKDKVDQSPLMLMEQGVPGARPAGRQSRLLSFAGAFAAVVLLVGLTVVQVDLFSPDTSTTNDTFPINTVTTQEKTTEKPTTTTTNSPPSTLSPGLPSTSIVIDGVAPDLVITYPENGAKVTEKSLQFEGTTEPGAVVAAGPYLAEVAADGHWSIVLLLNPGGNLASFTSTDAAGNVTEVTVSVTYDPPAPLKSEPPATAFTAHNTWGSCAESPPYDEYYGTAKPGTRVEVISAYGSGSTTVAGNGEWYVKVFFETAPYGKTFEVKAKDGFGTKIFFEFTSLVEK
ncbi:MAG: hypothetical protein RI637_03135 [Acidimicrobiia bacterium]|nr:hypothetical protein [Acidimicrobiia bacterium]